jgi:tetratricopeptide (TPR) repeat protein
MSVEQLDDHTYVEVTRLSEEGNLLAEQNLFVEAKAKFIEALRLLPTPHSNWEAATWLYVGIGDMHFGLKVYEKMMYCFINAMQCPGGLGNPFIHLRLGQAYFELQHLDKAADELTRAYMGAGLDIFKEDNGKYLEFLKSRIIL